MGTTSTGWLKPHDLSKRAVARRSLRLLGDALDEDQRAQAERWGGFAVHKGDRVFWIPLDAPPWCAFADDGRVERYCIAPDDRGGMPEGDIAMTYLLWITTDPDGFVREANVLRTTTIEWPDSESELHEKLAELGGSKGHKPASPRRKAPRAPKATTASPTASQVRAIFARHGRSAPDDLVKKLTD